MCEKKIIREAAIVQHEVRVGRLQWTWEDVQSLIQPFPKRSCDAVLELVGDHQHLDEGEVPYAEEAAVADEDNMSDWEECPDEEMEVGGDKAEGSDAPGVADASAVADDALAVPEVARKKLPLQAEAAEGLDDSEALVAAYQQAIDVLKQVGAVTAMQQLHNEKHKELRRQRVAAKENPAVAVALAELKEARAKEERETRLAIRKANRQEQELKRLRQESQAAQALVSKKKRN